MARKKQAKRKPTPPARRESAARTYQETPGLLIGTIARLMRARFHERARTLGLTRAQWTLLNRVSHQEGITQNELADMLEVSVVTVSRMIDSLQHKGWLERHSDPHDGRSRRIYLTSGVQPLMKQIDAFGQDTESEALKGLSTSDVGVLSRILKRMRANLQGSEARDRAARGRKQH